MGTPTLQHLFDQAIQHHRAGRLHEAEQLYRQMLVQKPDDPNALHYLGVIAHQTNCNDIAVELIRRALALQPEMAPAWSNLGSALQAQGQLEEAIAAFHKAIDLTSSYPEAHYNLGIALQENGQFDESVVAYRQAIALKPRYPDAYTNLGNVLKDQGELDQAIAAYRQALVLQPDLTTAHSNLVFTLHFHPGYDARSIAEEHRRWNQQHADPIRQLIHPHTNPPDPERRLRIGYLSPDFREHCQSLFTIPLFSAHDHGHYEIIAYADVACPDAYTHRLRGYADSWRNIAGKSDEQIAENIHEDHIDILVDLTMHMAHNHLLVFVRKPAPVQVTWLAYPGSTGLTTIDYRLSDPYLDPVGMDESIYSEKTIRLPDSFWCYDPLDATEIPLSPLPALQNAHVTFGCLNNFCKVNPEVLRLWAGVLRRVENSRLLLRAAEGEHRRRIQDLLEQEGIAPFRVDFVASKPRREYFQTYHRIDIGLDTLPYNGHTTSLDSCWMGVPVVTLVGQTIVGRAGLSQLTNLGLPELITHTSEEFVRIAVELANDLPRLKNLRRNMRQMMRLSPLMDALRFARNVEAAYRQMWRTWCEKQKPNR